MERILLDDTGNVKSRYQSDSPNLGNGRPSQEENAVDESRHVAVHDHPAAPATLYGSVQDDVSGERRGQEERDQKVSNPLKRKFDQPLADDWLFSLDELDVAQHLPPQPLLAKIADFFCISFHHWIPYIHKQRLQTRVREGVRYAGFDLVLHALVAVVLRHMDPVDIFLDQDQIRRQVKVSRMIVETYAIRDVSVESLQALIFVVFDHVCLFLVVRTACSLSQLSNHLYPCLSGGFATSKILMLLS